MGRNQAELPVNPIKTEGTAQDLQSKGGVWSLRLKSQASGRRDGGMITGLDSKNTMDWVVKKTKFKEHNGCFREMEKVQRTQ